MADPVCAQVFARVRGRLFCYYDDSTPSGMSKAEPGRVQGAVNNDWLVTPTGSAYAYLTIAIQL